MAKKYYFSNPDVAKAARKLRKGRRSVMTIYAAMLLRKVSLEQEREVLKANGVNTRYVTRKINTNDRKLDVYRARWNHIIEAGAMASSMTTEQLELARENALVTATSERDFMAKNSLRRKARVMTKAIRMKELAKV